MRNLTDLIEIVAFEKFNFVRLEEMIERHLAINRPGFATRFVQSLISALPFSTPSFCQHLQRFGARWALGVTVRFYRRGQHAQDVSTLELAQRVREEMLLRSAYGHLIAYNAFWDRWLAFSSALQAIRALGKEQALPGTQTALVERLAISSAHDAELFEYLVNAIASRWWTESVRQLKQLVSEIAELGLEHPYTPEPQKCQSEFPKYWHQLKAAEAIEIALMLDRLTDFQLKPASEEEVGFLDSLIENLHFQRGLRAAQEIVNAVEA